MGLNITLNTYSRLAPTYNRRSQLHHWSEYNIFKTGVSCILLISSSIISLIFAGFINHFRVSVTKSSVTKYSCHQKIWSPKVRVTKSSGHLMSMSPNVRVTKSSCHHMYVSPNVRVTKSSCHHMYVSPNIGHQMYRHQMIVTICTKTVCSAATWLSFWCSTWPSADTGTD